MQARQDIRPVLISPSMIYHYNSRYQIIQFPCMQKYIPETHLRIIIC